MHSIEVAIDYVIANGWIDMHSGRHAADITADNLLREAHVVLSAYEATRYAS